MLIKHFKLLKFLIATAILSICGCAGIQLGNSDATIDTEDGQTYDDAEWRYGSTGYRARKVAPLISKTIVFSDKKKKKVKNKD